MAAQLGGHPRVRCLGRGFSPRWPRRIVLDAAYHQAILSFSSGANLGSMKLLSIQN
jgi:hypothetical protein